MIKTVWQQYKDEYKYQWNRIEIPAINLFICCKTIFTKSTKITEWWERTVFLIHGVLGQLDIHGKE